jgi:2-hydroxychromene-2-carboxylate isomerase
LPRIKFWFDLASTYSYLTAVRIDELARMRSVEVNWRPFLLGPIFKAKGWNTSPFNLYPAKGRYMLRDMERLTALRGLPFVMPKSFPANSLLATRIAIAGEREGWARRFSRSVFEAEYGQGRDISSHDVLRSILNEMELATEPIFALVSTDAVKKEVRKRTDEAIELGIFGAPSFVSEDGELFWGDDRLEQAINWAARQ